MKVEFKDVERGTIPFFRGGMETIIDNPFSFLIVPINIPEYITNREQYINNTLYGLGKCVGVNSSLGWTCSPKEWIYKKRPLIIYQYKNFSYGRYLSYFMIPQNGLNIGRFIDKKIKSDGEKFKIEIEIEQFENVYKRHFLDENEIEMSIENDDVNLIFIMNNDKILAIKENMDEEGYKFDDCFRFS